MRRNQFGFAAEAARVWAWVWDIASDRLHWAISPEGLLGPLPASGTWPDFREMLHPDDRAGFVAAGRAAVDALSRKRRHVSYEAQFRVVRTDGVTRWMLGRGRAEADARGRPLRMIGVTVDIHERREAEQKAAATEARYRDFIEHSSEAVFRFELPEPLPVDAPMEEQVRRIAGEAVLAEANEAHARTYRHASVDAQLGLPAATFGGLELHHRFAEVFVRSGYRLDEVEWSEKIAGKTFWFRGHVVGIVEQGRLTGWWGTQTDIGDRKRAEQRLAESEERLRLAAEAGGVGVHDRNVRTGELYLSPRLKEILGYPPEAPLDRERVIASFHPDDVAAGIEAFRRACDPAGDGTIRIEQRIVRPDGEVRWISHLGKVFLKDGQPERTLGFWADVTERKRAEAEVRKWADAFEHCGHGIAMGDARTQLVLACNPAFARMLGRTPREVTGTRVIDVYAPEARAQARERIEQAERTGRASFESSFRRADGGDFPVQVDLVNVNDAAGRPVYRIATVQDLSERRRVERVKNSFADAIENAAIEMVLCDTEDRIVLASRAFREGNAARLAWLEPGAPYADFLREGLRRGIPHEAIGQEEAWLARRLEQRGQGGQPFEQRQAADRWILVTDHRMPDGGMLTSGIDISGQKRAQLALAESERRFRDLAAASGEWFWETDAEHRFTWFSEDIERNAGVKRDWYFGRSRLELAAAAGADLKQESWRSHLRQLERHEPFRDLRYERRVADGVRWVTTSGVPVFGGDGSFRGYRGTGTDISRQVELERRAEDSLRDANMLLESRVQERTEELGTVVRELEAFTYSASHDLRAPLGAIHGFVHLLQVNEGQRLSEDGRKLLGFVEANASRMAQLLEGLLEFSRLGTRAVARYPVVTGVLVQEVIRELEVEGSAAIRVGPLPDCAGDALLLKQVWVNLLGNALKYSRGRSPATIDVGFGEGARAYYVRDNGVGFDMRHAAKLFGVFERLHDESEFEGTGLGLAIVERIVQRHGGRVWADSQPGEGATFYFTLEG